jgi:hypothetical protein
MGPLPSRKPDPILERAILQLSSLKESGAGFLLGLSDESSVVAGLLELKRHLRNFIDISSTLCRTT